MWQSYLQPASEAEALELLRQHAGSARIVAGGTDVLVELQRGVRPSETLIDISRLHELRYIRRAGDELRIGALATHNDVLASAECVRSALPLAQACAEVGAPQIRARATVAGNLVTASPANDTITPLLALGARLLLRSSAGERSVPLEQFYLGVRRSVLRPDELVVELQVPALAALQRGLFLKLGLRQAQAIAVLNLALVLRFDGEVVRDARITLGCLAPTIVHARGAEAYLLGRRLDAETCRRAGELACQDVSPIDDIRGSAHYRLSALAALLAHGLERVAQGRQAEGWPDEPVLLEIGQEARSMKHEADSKEGARALPLASSPEASAGGTQQLVAGEQDQATSTDPASSFMLHASGNQQAETPFQGSIETIINGRSYQLSPEASRKSLLDALRQDAGLTGSKEGCAEGECGACTIWIDGQAAMACLVPAPQAHGRSVTTIEGLAQEGQLHPLQRAFISHGAVQCGYCIPGMLMAGARLLQEHPRPSRDQAQVALSGNICRCTGYRKILDAVLSAAQEEQP